MTNDLELHTSLKRRIAITTCHIKTGLTVCVGGCGVVLYVDFLV